jgi:hypothetical protein
MLQFLYSENGRYAKGKTGFSGYLANSANRERIFRSLICFAEYQSRISISLPQQKGTTSPAFTWTVLLQVTQYTSVS